MFSDQNGIKLKINNRKIDGNPHIFWELVTHFHIALEVLREFLKYFELNENKIQL